MPTYLVACLHFSKDSFAFLHCTGIPAAIPDSFAQDPKNTLLEPLVLPPCCKSGLSEASLIEECLGTSGASLGAARYSLLVRRQQFVFPNSKSNDYIYNNNIVIVAAITAF